ncbi:aminotransferase class I/II-fold pyridoxal phosphate-dependent enzyme [Fictibacillus nanhaiensis]|uniref:aminotransferase class I/II-fold pyridoxal phosphate-dependent enzyme n=1 Tax=Fictibacillus nanhaiensis TaxID=742169 RepID=UPI001C946083|nr:aminotransferase class I/II-fold pyridoxal phosphate-dependent enzyme [Fictibacillus nanhaiensis]MBY6038551.1 aminotransferase class I/II-fold pyridoxal phosphate-dependent enzyme [Fictibacillus nanhaiensis]
MNRAPLFEALIQHTKKSKWSFHVPGHKSGQIFEKNAFSFFQSVLPLDVTELTGLDDLHHPEGAIQEAQELLGSLYKVKNSYFLVGGSTSGNLAMILASFGHGDVVLVQRNCHKSVLNGLELSGAYPVFLSPEMDVEGGFPLGVNVDTVEKALEVHLDIKGIILTNPTYYGMQQDIQEISDIVHRKGGVVLVDEAHGAHFGLKEMPKSAIHKGADIVVQSAHKTLPALTMGAFLHVNSDRIDKYRLSHALQMIQSSSPSYLIMASLDLSRMYMEKLTAHELGTIAHQSERFRMDIDNLECLQTVKTPKGYVLDPLKVTVQTDRDISGYELQHMFEEEGLFSELADERNVLFILPLGMMDDLTQLKEVFSKISYKLSLYKIRKTYSKPLLLFPSVSTLSVSYNDMKKMSVKELSIQKADGFIAAEAIIPYPPGIPLIAKGEKITSACICHYFFLKEKGARFQGVNELEEMYVFDIR